MRFFNEYNENIGMTATNYMADNTVEELSLLSAKSIDGEEKTLAEEMIAGSSDANPPDWLKQLTPA
jgi:hypothetical protein